MVIVSDVTFDDDIPTLVTTRKLAENKLYAEGDEIDLDNLNYDRLVFWMAREIIIPASGVWADLPEPLFTHVMEMRD